MDKNKIKASMTMEAIVVMPTILIIIFAVFFAFQILYQHVVLEYAASYGATRGAMLWDYKSEGINFMEGTVDEKVGIYNNLDQMLTGSGVSERKEMITEQTKNIADSLTLMSGDINVGVEYDGKLTGRFITVHVSQEIAVPFKSLIEFFGNEDMTLKASSSAALYDPDEYIRNIDYIYELAFDIADQVADKFNEINSKRKKQ